MKLKNKQVANIVIGLSRFGEKREVKEDKARLPVGLGMKFAVAKQLLTPHFEAFEEVRDELIDEYVKRNEAGQKLKKGGGDSGQPEQWDMGENDEAFKKAYKELLNTEVEVARLTPIKFVDFKVKEEDLPSEYFDIFSLLHPFLELE